MTRDHTARQLLLAGALLVLPAHALLQLSAFSNSVFGAPAALSLQPSIALPPFDTTSHHSFTFDGTLTPPADELILFSARVSGTTRLFVDDHLVLDDATQGCARSITSWQGWPAKAGVAAPFRLQFTHDVACPAPVLEVIWEGNSTALAPIPSDVLGTPPASGPRAELTALRARLYEPVVPWQTYYAPSMTSHSLQPTGLLLQFSVADVQSGSHLGDVRVFPDFSPAWVRAGGHSSNGSDYTAVHVTRWFVDRLILNVTVSIFTSTANAVGLPCNGTEGNGGARCDLMLLAACEGSDCGRVQLVASASYAWTGSGQVVLNNASALTATPDGFPPTTAFACSPASLADSSCSSGAPPLSLQLPFVTRATLPWTGTGGGSNVLVAVVSTGGLRSIDEVVGLIAAARSRYDAVATRYGNVTDLYEGMRSVLHWDTLYAHYVGVYTPVSRNWYSANGGDSIGSFVWDVFFASIMFSSDADDARARDLALMNTITTMLTRTMSGMVPNYMSGRSGTYDRTEPAVGAWTVRVLRDRFGAAAAWLPELLLPSLLNWSDWFHDQRRNTGILAAQGANGLSDAISLGSGATDPAGLNTPHTLAAARYESGLDNSPQYDGDDGLCSGPSCPCRFNATTSLMNLYDVAFTAYHIVDADAIIALAEPLGRTDLIPRMRERSQRAASALNTSMWSDALGVNGSFANLLISGDFVPRWAPTIFSPLFAGIVERGSGRVESLARMMGDPALFCVNATHTGSGGAHGAMLLNIGAPGAATSASCVSDACLVEAVLKNVGTDAELQANVQASPAVGLVPLVTFSAGGVVTALATADFAPANPFVPVRTEGFCASTPSAAAPVPLTLWSLSSPGHTDVCTPHTGKDYVGFDLVNKTVSSATVCCAFCKSLPACRVWKWAPPAGRCYLKSAIGTPVPCPDCIVGSVAPLAQSFATCATAACNASAAAAGLTPSAPMCYASAALTPDDWPCAVPLPSIARSDAAFGEQTYWRGRAWAPQTFLTWLALQRYADVAVAADLRKTLVDMATRVFRRQLSLFGQVNENVDGLVGLGSDSNRADSFYTWGALNAFVGLIEAGAFPADVLVTPARGGAT